MMDLSEKLYNRALEAKGIELDKPQSEKFKFACGKAIIENPGLSFNELLIAANIYLNLIIQFPHLDLGPVIKP